MNAHIDPKWINLDTVRHWLDTCDRTHTNFCTPGNSEGTRDLGHPVWLIDVHRGCLISCVGNEQYAALSYVWGDARGSETTRDNLEGFLQEKSLLSAENGIPLTILHSIYLVKILKIPYLWVDRYCIIQDDIDIKHSQMDQMAGIFANSYVTIIAANGWDANHGLRGIQGVTNSRYISPNDRTNLRESLQPYSSIWYSRGWTFQEMICPPRKIMFHYQTLVWQCNCQVRLEYPPAKRSEGPDLVDRFAITPWKSLYRPDDALNIEYYIDAIGNYNLRDLRFPEDVHRGIAGLINLWSKVLQDGFISGLPYQFFTEALLWLPLQPMKRRVPTISGNMDVALPSWSWVGWQGAIDTTMWKEVLLSKNVTIERLEYCLQPINTSSCERKVLETGNLVKDVKTKRENQQVSFLYGKVRVARIAGFGLSSNVTFGFLNYSSKILLNSPTFEGSGGFLVCQGTDEYPYETGLLELISIAKGTVNRRGIHVLRDYFEKRGRTVSKFYFVLWIGWNFDQTAYRRGGGFIDADLWDEKALDTIDVTLA